MPKVMDLMVSVQDAAELLTLSRQRIVQLEHEGLWRRAHGKLRLADVVQGYIRFLRDEARRSGKSPAQSRVADARAIEIELRTAERRRLLIPTETALGICEEVIGAVRVEMAGVGPSITRELALRAKVEDSINGGLGRVADLLAERARALRSNKM